MPEKIIKSSDRVKNHGEVFTPKRIVDLMLNQPEIQAKINDLTATFLEPSAGEGAFLVELLRRKLKVAKDQSNSIRAFNENSLIALSTLYGIEFLADNAEMLVMNMITTFNEVYANICENVYNTKPNKHVVDSAKVIIQANMVQGDTLKQIRPDGGPIIFSEWKVVPGNPKKVQRTEYTFEAIINESGPTNSVENYAEEIDLFADSGEFDDVEKASDEPVKQYKLVKWMDIYKQLVE